MFKKEFIHKNAFPLLSLISLLLYALIGYQLKREDFYLHFLFYTILFIIYIYFIKYKWDYFKELMILSIFVRLILIFCAPKLSADIYRYLWDGNLNIHGINPYAYTPVELMKLNYAHFPLKDEVFMHLSGFSTNTFSSSPGLSQFIYSIPAFLAPRNMMYQIVIYRIIIFLFEFILIYILYNIIMDMKQNKNKLILYTLNPLVVIEITGNLHSEAIMICFVLLSLYFLMNNKVLLSSILFAASASIKPISLILLPLFYRFLKFNKWILYFLIVELGFFILFLPFKSWEIYNNYIKGIVSFMSDNYFNASIMAVFKNPLNNIPVEYIKLIIISVLVIAFIIGFSISKKNKYIYHLYTSIVFLYALILFISPVVQPWFIVLPVCFTIFTKYRFFIIWSFLIYLSYSAYIQSAFNEINALVIVEYSLVLIFIFFEFIRKKALPFF